MNPYFHKTNYNPWHKVISDCAIRAVSAGIGLSYQEVCKVFHVTCKKGYGLLRNSGIDLNDIKKKFNNYFGNVTDFNEDVPPELRDMANDVMAFDASLDIDDDASGITLNEFIELYPNGKFLVGLITPDNKKDGHIVYANCDKQYFIDIYDSGDFIVDAWMQIKKTVPVNSPKHWKYDYDKHCFIV